MKQKTASIRQLVYPDGRLDPRPLEIRRRKRDLERQGYHVYIDRLAVKLAVPKDSEEMIPTSNNANYRA